MSFSAAFDVNVRGRSDMISCLVKISLHDEHFEESAIFLQLVVAEIRGRFFSPVRFVLHFVLTKRSRTKEPVASFLTSFHFSLRFVSHFISRSVLYWQNEVS